MLLVMVIIKMLRKVTSVDELKVVIILKLKIQVTRKWKQWKDEIQVRNSESYSSASFFRFCYLETIDSQAINQLVVEKAQQEKTDWWCCFSDVIVLPRNKKKSPRKSCRFLLLKTVLHEKKSRLPLKIVSRQTPSSLCSKLSHNLHTDKLSHFHQSLNISVSPRHAAMCLYFAM